MRIADHVVDLVGGTPLVRLNRVIPAGSGTVAAKLEFLIGAGDFTSDSAIELALRARPNFLAPIDEVSEFIGSDAEDAEEAAAATATATDAATDIAAFDVYDDEVETSEDTKA